MITFHVHEDGKLLRAVSLSSTPGKMIKIGRAASADLQFEDHETARMHAIIECNYDGIFVIDVGASVGKWTIVNGEKIQRTKLKSGDVILIGRKECKVIIDVDTVIKA